MTKILCNEKFCPTKTLSDKVHEATDFTAQLVAVKALFISEIYQLKIETNRLRENINKVDQNTGDNNLYQEYKIKNYYLEQQNSLLKQESTLKQYIIDKLCRCQFKQGILYVEFLGSSQCKDINFSKELGQKTIDIGKKRYRLRIQKSRRPSCKLQPYGTTA